MTLLAQSIRQSYGTVRALDGVDLSFTGDACALVGVNGAGKTTLLTVLAGGLRPDQGSVTVAGQNLYRWRSRTSALARTVLMPQRFGYPRSMTALEFVSYLTWMRNVPWGQARERARVALENVQLGQFHDARMGAMSGGMVRRVGLAQALAARADVILLDEPSTGLDPEQRRIMIDLLRSLTGAQILMSSHVMEDVVEVATRIVVLDKGQVKFDGTVAQLAARSTSKVESSRAVEAGFLEVIGRRRP